MRKRLSAAMPDVRFSFEPADIVNEVMSFGSPTPVEIAVSGPNFADDRQYAEKVRRELAKIPSLRDLQVGQSLDYPTIDVNVDREKAGLAGIDAGRCLASRSWRRLRRAGSLSRTTGPIPRAASATRCRSRSRVRSSAKRMARTPIGSADALAQIPLKQTEKGQVLIGDVATIQPGTMPGQFDRYNMRRQITLTANVSEHRSWRRYRGKSVVRSVELAHHPPACKSTPAAKSRRCSKCNRD